MGQNISWTPEEDARLRIDWPSTKTRSEVAAGFPGRTRAAVESRVHVLGLGRNTAPAWTGENVADLKKMVGEGQTSTEIAAALGKSPNSVIGKIHRLKLIRPPRRLKKAERRKEPAAEIGGKTLADLGSGECVFPLGEVNDRAERFCGAPVLSGKVYCREHCQVAYRGDFDEETKAAIDG